MGLPDGRYARKSIHLSSLFFYHIPIHNVKRRVSDSQLRMLITIIRVNLHPVRNHRPDRTDQETFPHLLVTYRHGPSFPTPWL